MRDFIIGAAAGVVTGVLLCVLLGGCGGEPAQHNPCPPGYSYAWDGDPQCIWVAPIPEDTALDGGVRTSFSMMHFDGKTQSLSSRAHNMASWGCTPGHCPEVRPITENERIELGALVRSIVKRKTKAAHVSRCANDRCL